MKSMSASAVKATAQSPPAREAWIEMLGGIDAEKSQSGRLPRGRRGLKSCIGRKNKMAVSVASREGGVD